MIRVALDWSTYHSPSGGGYRYVNELVRRLSHRTDLEFQILGLESFHRPPRGANVKHVARATPSASWFPDGALKRRLSKLRRRWEARSQSRHLRKDTIPTLFHAPYYTVPPDPKMPLVLTVHDLIEELFHQGPETSLMQRKRAAILRAQRYICVTENTKKDLLRRFSVEPSAVDVIHLGVDYEFFSAPIPPEESVALAQRYHIREPYVLYVGGRLDHKNFPRALQAYAEGAFRKDYRLVVVGSAWLDEELALLKKFGVPDRVSLFTGVDDLGLKWFFQNASVFLYPSLYEGFGLPPLEAMAAGAPVAASRAGSIPEVVGEAALLFDPHRPEEITKAVEEALGPDRAKALRQAGRERARRFTWDRCAELTADTYHRVFEVPARRFGIG